MAFSKKNQSAIRGLVVAYHGFCEACDRIGRTGYDDTVDLDIIVWGDAVLERQKELGIQMMVNPENTQILIDSARRRRNERKEIAA